MASGFDYQPYDDASVSLSFAATPGATYTAVTQHCFRLQSWDNDNVYPYQLYYYDNWNMSSFVGQNIYSPLDYFFASPGYGVYHRPTNFFCVGKTYGSVTVPPPPSVTISQIKAVGVDQTALIRFVVKNPDGKTINLALAQNSGTTGSAKFTGSGGTDTSTRTITTQTTGNNTANVDVEITGVTESSTKQSMILSAKFTDANSVTKTLGSITFTVIKLTLSAKAASTDQPSSDNAIGSNYQNATGRQTLGGPFFNTATYPTFQLPHSWRHAIEIKAVVLPSDFDQNLTLQRIFIHVYT